MSSNLTATEMAARWEYFSPTPETTQAVARRLAPRLQAGDFLALCGELGSGKTCFAQGLAAGLQVQGRVSSPSFVLMHYHPGALPLCHLDAYRVDSAEEFYQLGVDEYAHTSVMALEWADRVPDLWPAEVLVINLSYADSGRRLELIGRGARAAALVEELRKHDPSL